LQIQVWNAKGDAVLKEFGMNVADKLLSIDARILPSPGLIYRVRVVFYIHSL